jgi:hypothetical protein
LRLQGEPRQIEKHGLPAPASAPFQIGPMISPLSSRHPCAVFTVKETEVLDFDLGALICGVRRTRD